MTVIDFHPPNYRCSVSKKGHDEKFWRLCCADDETNASEMLERLGLVVHAIQPFDFETGWLKKAIDTRDQIIAAVEAGQPVDFPSFWRDLKDVLLDMFSSRCAYCEADFRAVSYGDVEHYRPKGRVDEDEDHPGYYWLAYEPQNYLPACQLCNQYAKRSHFPIAPDGVRAYGPADSLDAEHALLLNPCQDIHSQHIAYRPSKETKAPAEAFSLDDKGRQTIETMELNRQELVDMRFQQQLFVRMQIKQAMSNEDIDSLRWLLYDVLSGKCSFPSACMCEINDYYITMGLPSPFPLRSD